LFNAFAQPRSPRTGGKSIKVAFVADRMKRAERLSAIAITQVP
jgi:hypothetical protein